VGGHRFLGRGSFGTVYEARRSSWVTDHARRGLAALHGQGRIHGDVKPENILRVGARWTIGDFGLSTALDGSYAFTAGATIDYRPPEHAAAPAGSRMHRSADVWALGITLHVAATGHHPFVGPDPVMRLAAAIRGDRTATAVEPAALRAVVDDACLRREPRDRPDAATVADRLRAVAAGAGSSVEPPSWAPAGGPPHPAAPRQAAPAGVVGPTVPAPRPKANPPCPSAHPPPRGRPPPRSPRSSTGPPATSPTPAAGPRGRSWSPPPSSAPSSRPR
jgi:serine/threonine protein kinase